MSFYSMNHKCGLAIDEVCFFEMENETDGQGAETGDMFYSAHDLITMQPGTEFDACLQIADIKDRILGNVQLGSSVPTPPSSNRKGQLLQACIQATDKVTLYLFRIKSGQDMKFGGAPPFQVAGNPDGCGCAEILSDCCFIEQNAIGDDIVVTTPQEIYFSGEPAAPTCEWAGFVFNGVKAKHRVSKFMMAKESYAVVPNFVNLQGERKMVGLEVNGRGWPHPCPDWLRIFAQ